MGSKSQIREHISLISPMNKPGDRATLGDISDRFTLSHSPLVQSENENESKEKIFSRSKDFDVFYALAYLWKGKMDSAY